MLYRYAVMVNGRKAIHEALVMKSVDFADRTEFILNRSKGSTSFAFV